MTKRIIALLLALILTVGLLPTVALAAEGGETPTTGAGDVKNGYYEGTTWKEGTLNQGTLPTGVETVSKTAKPTSNPNEYEVTLEVVLKKTESQEKPGAAATVLVLDHSGSMNGCAYCKSTKSGSNYYHTEGCQYYKPRQSEKVTSAQSRMTAATKAVKDFIKTYSGRFDENGKETSTTDLNLGRWVCLVWFNETGGLTGGSKWVDVSNKSGYQTATNTDGWKAHDGTNLDCGLRLADHWLKQSPVASINKSLKNVIVLSDGEPTYHLSKSWEVGDPLFHYDITIDDIGYYVHGNGGSCDEDTYNTTKSTAATLRNSASVYTVCFGASGNEIKDYDKNGNQKITVGNYLKQKIATQPKSGSNEKFAYDAADADALNTAFAAISKTIVSGLSTGTVKDSLPDGISATGMSGEMTWKLDEHFIADDPKTTTAADGKKVTTYRYTKTYTVTIDPDDEKLVMTEDGYAPLNGKTTLTVKSGDTNVEIPFPIPAGKVTPTKITDEITVTITGATNTETYDGTEKKAEGYTVTISDPRYTTNDFTFSGTNVVKATNASKNQYMMGLKADNFTNNNEKFTNVKFVVNDGWLLIDKKPLTIEANDNTVDYDGKPHGEDGYVATGLAEGDTVESVTFNGSQTNPGTYENLLVPSEAVIKNAKGDDVKDNYIITYTPGTLVINKLTNAITVTITGTQETKVYNGQTQTVTGFTYTVEGEGAGHNDVTVTLKTGNEAKASGKDVLVGTDGKYDATLTYPMHLTADCFDVSSTKYSNVTIEEVKDGWLKITPIAITLKSGDDSKTYDGAALTKNEVTVISGSFVEGEGLTYNVTGSRTEVGSSKNAYTYTAKDGTILSNYTITEKKGTLTVTLPNPSIPTVTVDCINSDVSHNDKTGIALTAATQYELGDPQKVTNEIAYTRTITLTDAGKEYCIGEYNKDIAGHTEAAGGTTTITLKYSKEGSEWAWRATPANFLVNVQCDTPTVNVTYTWSGLDSSDFDETYPVPAEPDDATPKKGSDYTVDSRYNNSSIANGKDGVRYKFSGWSTDATIHNGQIKSIQNDVTLTGTWTKLGSGTFDLTDKIFKSFTLADGSNEIPDGTEYTFAVHVKPYGETEGTLHYGDVKFSGKDVKDGKKLSFGFYNRAEIECKIPGTYTYLVGEDFDREAHPDGVVDKIHYDTKQYLLTITVNGDMTVSYGFADYPQTDGSEVRPKDTITFKNEYFEDPNADVVTLDLSNYVTKTFESRHGKSATETFKARVEIWVDDVQITTNAAAEEDSIAIYAAANREKVYDKTGTVTLSTGETQHFRFDSLATLERGRRYRIIVTETAGSNPDVEYDSRVYDTQFGVNSTTKEIEWYRYGGNFSFTNIYTGIDDYYPIIIPTIINKDTGMLNKTDHFAYVIGYPDGTVHPNGQITRAEVATIFFRLLRDEVRDGAFTTSNTYSDVAYGKWYNNPISTMSALGIITGYPDGTFKPNKPITRAEFAAIAARFDETQSGKSATFSDVIGHWAAKEIGIAYYNDWIKGYPDGTFKPDQNITRAEAMTLINRVLERKPESPADLLTNMNKWTDNMDTSKWYYLDVQEATNSHGYTRKTFNYELWRQMLPDPDWSRYER